MKKTYSNWYAALVHYFIAGMVVPIIGIFIFSLAYYLIGLNLYIAEGGVVEIIIFTLVGFILSWFGAQYSARLFKRNIEVASIARVIVLATVYLAVIFIVTIILYFSLEDLAEAFPVTGVEFVGQWVVGILDIVVFYLVSKYHFKKVGLLS